MQIQALNLPTIRVTQAGRVLTARFATVAPHFIGADVIRDLDVLTRTVDRDPSVGAVIFTGATDRRFLTHADPAEFEALLRLPQPQLSAETLLRSVQAQNLVLRLPGAVRVAERFGGALGEALAFAFRWKRAVLRMNRSSTVYLAAINGPALGGGHEIALACDLRFAADAEHVRLGQIESLANLTPGGGGTQRLPGIIGTGHALELMLEGRPLTTREGLELGLVHDVVDEEQLLAHVGAVAERLARRSPASVRGIKRSVYFAARRRLSRGLDYELAALLAASITPGAARTLTSFAQDQAAFGDSPFLANPAPWLDGHRVDQVTGAR